VKSKLLRKKEKIRIVVCRTLDSTLRYLLLFVRIVGMFLRLVVYIVDCMGFGVGIVVVVVLGSG
jgi:hypothetical protein